MKKLFKILSVIGMAGCYAPPALAESEKDCSWAYSSVTEDDKYKYFTAWGYSKDGYDAAQVKARSNINEQLCDYMGTYVSRDSKSYETERIEDSTSSTTQRIKCAGMIVKDFEEDNRGREVIDGESVICLRYKYLKTSLLEEKNRIEADGFNSADKKFNAVAGDSNCEGQPLEFVTDPDRALVTVDNKKEYSGYTPFSIGKLCKGKHKILITRDDYKEVYKTIAVGVDANPLRVNEKLSHGSQKYKFTTNLGDSYITVYDLEKEKVVKSGIEPLTCEVNFDWRYKIDIENEKMQGGKLSFTEEKFSAVRSSKIAPKKYTVAKSRSKIDFWAFKQHNPDVSIFVDDKEVKEDTVGELTPDVSHIILFKNPDDVEIKFKKVLKPGESFDYPAKTLKFKSKKSKTEESEGISDLDEVDSLDKTAWLWLGATYNTGDYSKDGFKMPLKSYGVSGNIFLGRRFSLDFNFSGGSFNQKYEAPVMNYSDPFLNYDVDQYYTNLYGGVSYYLIQNYYFSPFVGIGYNSISGAYNDVKKFETNYMREEDFIENTLIKSEGVMFTAGLQMGILRAAWRYRGEYSDWSLGITVPIKF
ncbi:MAG: porin family protein [Alphaproteobacteria bacterium]|nr:porin family protein [Alphaproteobacteria bacterium]